MRCSRVERTQGTPSARGTVGDHSHAYVAGTVSIAVRGGRERFLGWTSGVICSGRSGGVGGAGRMCSSRPR
jgi:hypothetical protein